MGDLAGSGCSKNSKNMKIEPINRIFHFISYSDLSYFFWKLFYIFFEFLKNLNFLRFLWRTELGAPQKCENSVAHQARCATEKYFSGEISVAHPAGPGVCHRNLKRCATDSDFCSSDTLVASRSGLLSGRDIFHLYSLVGGEGYSSSSTINPTMIFG